MLPSPEMLIKMAALGGVSYWIWRFCTWKKRAEDAEYKLLESETEKKIETAKANTRSFSISDLVKRINERRRTGR